MLLGNACFYSDFSAVGSMTDSHCMPEGRHHLGKRDLISGPTENSQTKLSHVLRDRSCVWVQCYALR